MDFLLFNLHWMSLNIVLALVPVFFGRMMMRSRDLITQAISAIIWLVFLPNTIYLITDPVNLARDIKYVSGFILVLDVFLYLILAAIGIVTFVISLNYFEKTFISNKKLKKHGHWFLYAVNLLVGFGIVLGRFQRTNSWYVVTNTQRVVEDSLGIMKSFELLILVIVFAVFCQFIYSKFSDRILGAFK